MKSKRLLRKVLYLENINNFDDFFDENIKKDILKKMFDNWIKKNLTNKLAHFEIQVNSSDFELLESIWLTELKVKSPFHSYYNLKYNRLNERIYLKLPKEIITLEQETKLNNNKKYADDFFKTKIKSYIKDVFYDDLTIYSLVTGDINEMKNKLQKEIKELRGYKAEHTNRKGKEWRDKVLELAKNEFTNNPYISKEKALRNGFEKSVNKEIHRKEFDLKYDSIYRKFIKLV